MGLCKVNAFIDIPKTIVEHISKRQNFGRDQIESVSRGQIKCIKMVISVFDRVENIGGKGENAGYHHFSPFPPIFFKKPLTMGSKNHGLFVKWLLLYQTTKL